MSAERTLFHGTARRVIMPGEQGTFEVLPLHRPLVSRLVAGPLVIDGYAVLIHRWVMRVVSDAITAVVEL